MDSWADCPAARPLAWHSARRVALETRMVGCRAMRRAPRIVSTLLVVALGSGCSVYRPGIRFAEVARLVFPDGLTLVVEAYAASQVAAVPL